MSAQSTPIPEPTSRIEPCLLGAYPPALADLIAELVSAAEGLGARLQPSTARSLADLVRVMNCYYSNLIEGHDTRPRDIQRALDDQLEADVERRELQLEARAHIRVQEAIDLLHARGELAEPAKIEHLRWLHRSFYAGASANMLRVAHADGDYPIVPGEFRWQARHDVAVGRHQPPSSHRVTDFMIYFEQRYRFEKLGRAERIAAIAASHHRFNYIHPFVDGNGRVSRLMSHGASLCAGIGAHGLWSISRGLARGLADAGEYKRMMDDADSPRRGDLDGRANLSTEALVHFTTWFCRVALDQVQFMSRLFDLSSLEQRLTSYVQEALGLPEDVAAIPLEVLRRGEMARGEAARVTGRSERSARSALGTLVQSGLLVSDTAKGAVRLHFSADSADVLFPRLFGAQIV